ncbi:MAG: endonuclease III [Pseudomonadota bacterium]
MKKPKPEQTKKIFKILAKMYPDVRTALRHESPLQLLVSTILSAQCTDERVNQVTPELFRRLKTAKDFAEVPREELEDLVRSTGFFRSKARAIQEAARQIRDEFGGRVPDTMEELTRLRGVGRKTANVVLGSAFGKNEGVVVDTHVGRVSRRLHLTRHEDPVKVESDLMELVPRKDWTIFSHRLVWHGRKLCKARKPLCGSCALAPLCPSAEV